MQLMRLVRASVPFDRPDFIYEIKLDGFRAAAFVEQDRCRLFSRNGREFRRWAPLTSKVAAGFRGRSAVIDGELVCLSVIVLVIRPLPHLRLTLTIKRAIGAQRPLNSPSFDGIRTKST